MTLSKRQQKAAKVAAEQNQLDAHADVDRGGTRTPTPTGPGAATMQHVYAQIPCHLAAYRPDGPPAQDNGPVQEIDQLAVGLFPAVWSPTPDTVAPSAVVIHRGDTITVDGVVWYATTGLQNPAVGFQALRRVQLSRTIEGAA